MTIQRALLIGSFVLVAGTPLAHAQCEDKIVADDGTSQDKFGSSAAMEGTLAVVGAPFEGGARGAAYVYQSAGGTWSQSDKLTAQISSASDQFGTDLDLSGDTVVVGAPFSSTQTVGQCGSAHVYRNVGGGGWTEVQMIRASNFAFEDHFGFSVAIDGDRMAVGAPFKNLPGMSDAGAVYVYQDIGGAWIETQILTASDMAAGDLFGLSVSLSGDTLIVGAPFEDAGGNNAGAAYAFQLFNNSWVETQKLTPSLPVAGDEFGRDVSHEGDVLAIGAPRNDQVSFDAGAVYVFERPGLTWIEAQSLVASNAGFGDRFGTTVAASATMIVGGSPLNDGPQPDRGSAHVYTSPSGGWIEVSTLYASDGDSLDRFGCAVAASHTHALVGAIQNDQVATNAGAAYVYPIVGRDCNQNGVIDACELTTFTSFCFGDGGTGFGCTDCPCGNEAQPGSCGGCLNGAGGSAQLIASGVPSLLNDSMRVDMVGANPNTFAVLGSGSVQMPSNQSHPCFGLNTGLQSNVLDGLRCAGGNFTRHGSRATDSNGAVGATNNPWGDEAYWILLAGFLSGQTRHYQSYYREIPALSCGTGQNTTQAFSVTYLP